MKYSTSILINAPVAKVYKIMVDQSLATQWLKGLESVEPLEGTPGQVGYKSKYFYNENGRKVVFFEEVTSIDPQKSFSFRIFNDDLNLEVLTNLIDYGEKTQVSMSNQAVGNSIKMKILLTFLKGVMKKRQIEDLKRLKNLVESKD